MTDLDLFPWDRDWVAGNLRRPVPPADLVWRGDTNAVYRFGSEDAPIVYLKIGPNLRPERDRLMWLSGRLPVPRVLSWRAAERDLLLLSPVPGHPLHVPGWRARPERVARLMGQALRALHAADSTGCPFGRPAPGAVLTHGDACLPNILADERGVTAYIDLGEAGLAAPEVDLAAALWSLQYNLGPGFARPFLQAYGRTLSDAEIEDLRQSYQT